VVALAVAVGLGVAALPISWGWSLRGPFAFVAFVATFQLFVRVPGLSNALVRMLSGTSGVMLVVVVVTVSILIVVHPAFNVSGSVVRVLVAAASGTVSVLLFAIGQVLTRRTEAELTLSPARLVGVLLVAIVYGLSAGLAFVVLREPDGPMRDSIQGAISVGLLVPPFVIHFARAGAPNAIQPGAPDIDW
jgi:hypothetical protein